MVKLGILSDTHVPDRARGVPEALCSAFREAGVSAILHAGDICIPTVLQALEKIAPVFAVRGNRDIYYLRSLPVQLGLEFEGVRVGLVHGHGKLTSYMLDKIDFFRRGVREERYRNRALQTFPDARLVIFGHIHRRIHEWVGQQFLFNPGSVCCSDWYSGGPPSAGLISLQAGEITQVEFIDLDQG